MNEEEFKKVLEWALFEYGMGVEFLKGKLVSSNPCKEYDVKALFERFKKETK